MSEEVTAQPKPKTKAEIKAETIGTYQQRTVSAALVTVQAIVLAIIMIPGLYTVFGATGFASALLAILFEMFITGILALPVYWLVRSYTQFQIELHTPINNDATPE